MDQALVGVPALLPHGLQLVLVAVCWNGRGKGLVTARVVVRSLVGLVLREKFLLADG